MSASPGESSPVGSALPSGRTSSHVCGRQRRAAVRYNNVEEAANSPVLTKPNRGITFDVGRNNYGSIIGVIGSIQGWRRTMEDRHIISFPLREITPGLSPYKIVDSHRPSLMGGSLTQSPRTAFVVPPASKPDTLCDSLHPHNESGTTHLHPTSVSPPPPISTDDSIDSCMLLKPPKLIQHDLREDCVMFGVFDGHRGSDAAAFVADTLPQRLGKTLATAMQVHLVSSFAGGIRAETPCSDDDPVKTSHPIEEEAIIEAFEATDSLLREQHHAFMQRPQEGSPTMASSSGYTSACSSPRGEGSPAPGASSPCNEGLRTASVMSHGPVHPPVSPGLQGTTAHVVLVTNEEYVFCNLGDSRGYLVERRSNTNTNSTAAASESQLGITPSPTAAGSSDSPSPPSGTSDAGSHPQTSPRRYTVTVKPMSEDHRTSWEEERKRVVEAGGAVINGRVNGKLSVTRAFGDFDLKPHGDGTAQVSPLPIHAHGHSSAIDILMMREGTNNHSSTVNRSLGASPGGGGSPTLSPSEEGKNPIIAIPDIVRHHAARHDHFNRAEASAMIGSTSESHEPNIPSDTQLLTSLSAYDIIIIGCDGVWELQTAEVIGNRVVDALEGLFAALQGKEGQDAPHQSHQQSDTNNSIGIGGDISLQHSFECESQTASRAPSVIPSYAVPPIDPKDPYLSIYDKIIGTLKLSIAASLNAACSPTCDARGTTPGCDNITLGVLFVQRSNC